MKAVLHPALVLMPFAAASPARTCREVACDASGRIARNIGRRNRPVGPSGRNPRRLGPDIRHRQPSAARPVQSAAGCYISTPIRKSTHPMTPHLHKHLPIPASRFFKSGGACQTGNGFSISLAGLAPVLACVSCGESPLAQTTVGARPRHETNRRRNKAVRPHHARRGLRPRPHDSGTFRQTNKKGVFQLPSP